MFWLASAADQREQTHIRRFSPLYWSVNFPRPMMASVVTTGPDSLSVKLRFLKHDDLAGLIWESADTIDHPLLAYETKRDYSGTQLSFRWQATGLKTLDAINGPTLTIEGRDAGGSPRTWFVRLWNYAVGDPADAVITLDFDQLDGGFILPGEADPVYPHDIGRMFISLVADVYDPLNDGPIELSPGIYAARDASVTISGITVTGPGAVLAAGDGHVRVHGLKLANGYDDTFNITPARLLRNALYLGYRDWINHYVGMSHYYSLVWVAGEGRFVIDPALTKLNAPCLAWHQDFFALAKQYGFQVVVSLSFELLNENTPAAWKQRTHDGSAALTGWDPPSSLVAPTNTTAMTYLRDVLLAFLAEQAAITAPLIAQIGEPWWWHQLSGDFAPCFYDDVTMALYVTETGNPLPLFHETIFETPDAAQQAYLMWLGDKLGAATLWLRDEIKAAHASADVTLLFFVPQVLDPAAPMLQTVNFPESAWAYPAFDFLQVEDYDYVVVGDWRRHRDGLSAVVNALGYGPADSHYFSGFNLLPDTPQVWANIDRAIAGTLAQGYAEVFVWAYPQVVRDGFVYFTMEDDVSGFHEVRFSEGVSYGSSGGPRFSTTVTETISGHEQRNVDWQEARAEYDIGSGLRDEADLAAIIAFYRARRGRAYGFRFKDWNDYRSSADGGAVGPQDQLIGVGDGVTDSFQLVKNYISGVTTHTRTIGKPVAGTVRVALAGVEQFSGWLVDTTTGVITFDTPPGIGMNVSAGYEFDVPVRFRDDKLTISMETFAAGEAPAIGIVEIRV